MELEALLKTMLDELKDAQMMYDYACGSKKYGHDDLATFYITRAEQRLKMCLRINGSITKTRVLNN